MTIKEGGLMGEWHHAGKLSGLQVSSFGSELRWGLSFISS
jgi:hypothetical protein